MDTNDVRVLEVKEPGLKQPAFVLYTWPTMSIHETATRYLSELAKRSVSRNYQRTVAYALSHWHSYCLASNIDYRRADQDDLMGYMSAMSETVSESTGQPLSPGTIAQRAQAVCRYYQSGVRANWNLTATDINCQLTSRERSGHSIGQKHPVPIDINSRQFAPKRDHCESDIRALEPEELRRLLDELGPAEPKEGKGP
ncbi:MAG TPA: hypothetical protein VL997_07075, partial [Dyella sp.]|nr:hypothetical protein [Dyella sp.]